jgi:hypothetical protein
MSVLQALTAEPRKRLRRLIAGAVLACIGGAFALIGLGFATWAIFVIAQPQWGVAGAAAAIAAAYFVVAIGVFGWRAKLLSVDAGQMRSPGNRRSDEPTTNAQDSAETLAKKIATGIGAQPGAFTPSDELAKQLTPLQLVALAALNGFVAGRKS